MIKVYGGALIKKYRNERGITLKQLSKGICHPTTLHRIEGGSQSPNVFTFMSLIQRLGFESEKFFVSAFTKSEITFFNLYYEIEALIMGGKFDDAQSKLKILESTGIDLGKEGGEKIREQMIMVLKLSISQGRNEDAASRIETIKAALTLTNSDFDETEISGYMLSYDEIALLNMLATVYGDTGDSEKEIAILRRVKSSMDKYYVDKYEKSRGYAQTLLNLSNALGFAERHEEAIEICDTAIKYCVEHKRLHLLPHLKFNKACALFYIGNKDEYERLAIEAIYALRNNEDYIAAKERIEIAKERLGIIFPAF